MTENEIIKYIEQHGFISDEVKDATINAIKEIQRIKTVIDDFELECGGAVSSVLEMSYQLHKYLEIGSIEELQALKEKAEPKKPNDISRVRDNDGYIGLIGKCPCCGDIVEEDTLYCDCGQKLDWS